MWLGEHRGGLWLPIRRQRGGWRREKLRGGSGSSAGKGRIRSWQVVCAVDHAGCAIRRSAGGRGQTSESGSGAVYKMLSVFKLEYSRLLIFNLCFEHVQSSIGSFSSSALEAWL